jgi:hypothetical protein
MNPNWDRICIDDELCRIETFKGASYLLLTTCHSDLERASIFW